MNIIEALAKLRDDIKTWVTNNLVALNAKIEAHTIPIDSELNTNSSNPVQNKAVALEINSLRDSIKDAADGMLNITDDESAELNIVDPNGKAIMRVDADGVHTTSIETKTISTEDDSFVISDNADNAIFRVDANGVHTTNIEGSGEDFVITDVYGNIAFKVDSEGVQATDFKIDETSLKNKIPDWDAKSTFSGDYTDLENKPDISNNNSEEMIIADPKGNIIMKVNSSGVHTTDLKVGRTSLVNKIPEWDAKSNFSGDYQDLTNTPNIKDDDDSDSCLLVIDKNGNIIVTINYNGIITPKITLGKTELDEKKLKAILSLI